MFSDGGPKYRGCTKRNGRGLHMKSVSRSKYSRVMCNSYAFSRSKGKLCSAKVKRKSTVRLARFSPTSTDLRM